MSLSSLDYLPDPLGSRHAGTSEVGQMHQLAERRSRQLIARKQTS